MRQAGLDNILMFSLPGVEISICMSRLAMGLGGPPPLFPFSAAYAFWCRMESQRGPAERACLHSVCHTECCAENCKIAPRRPGSYQRCSQRAAAWSAHKPGLIPLFACGCTFLAKEQGVNVTERVFIRGVQGKSPTKVLRHEHCALLTRKKQCLKEKRSVVFFKPECCHLPLGEKKVTGTYRTHCSPEHLLEHTRWCIALCKH